MKIPKDFRPIIDKAKEAGWQLVYTGGGHLRLLPPDGSSGVTMASSPRNSWRSAKNLRRDLRQKGLDV